MNVEVIKCVGVDPTGMIIWDISNPEHTPAFVVAYGYGRELYIVYKGIVYDFVKRGWRITLRVNEILISDSIISIIREDGYYKGAALGDKLVDSSEGMFVRAVEEYCAEV